MKTKQLFLTLLSLIIILSGVNLVSAVGVWKNPTATPPGNNVDTPINVGTSAQDKAGVLRVTGFRSFFDAIFDTKVQIGTTAAMPSSLKLLVAGDTGSRRYCDELGQNCFTAAQVNSIINNTTIINNPAPVSTQPVYVSVGSQPTLIHSYGYDGPSGGSQSNYNAGNPPVGGWQTVNTKSSTGSDTAKQVRVRVTHWSDLDSSAIYLRKTGSGGSGAQVLGGKGWPHSAEATIDTDSNGRFDWYINDEDNSMEARVQLIGYYK